jgi:hypothetical protein
VFKRIRTHIFEAFDGDMSGGFGSGASGTYRDFGHIFHSAAEFIFQAMRFMMLNHSK